MDKKAKMRVQQISNCNQALDFVWKCGVQLKLKPQAEDLVDGREKPILGLIWAIMIRFMKFDDDDEPGEQQMDAKEALLMWVQNKIQGYDVTVKSFKKDFFNGMALCALIHKHRPRLIDWESLNPSNANANLEIAMAAAEKYFSLERYLAVEDVPKLDEKCMFVYVSEYYYGIAEQRKLDQAARRIGKLIAFTVENDRMKKEYGESADRLTSELDRVGKMLGDRTIDNTMAGARKKLDEFYEYKTQAKSLMIADQLNLQSLFNHLSMRLSHRKRPAFDPGEGRTLEAVDGAFAKLEECEVERKVALHAEVNRQIKLLKLDEQHKASHEKLSRWLQAKEEYLRVKEEIDSVGLAQYNLGKHTSYTEERAAVAESAVAAYNRLGAELSAEQYERTSEVQAREGEVKTRLATLDELSSAKRPVLEDHLAREQFREKLRLWNEQHQGKFGKIQAWTDEKEAYLKTKEEINSISEAQLQLGLLATFVKEKATMSETSVSALKALGQEILTAKYETSYSSYVFVAPDDIRSREATVDTRFGTLDELAAAKKKVLDDDLAREQFKEHLRLLNSQHEDAHRKIGAWVEEQRQYLNTHEAIDTVGAAQTALALFEAYCKDSAMMKETAVVALKKLGQEILTAKYETEYSQFVWQSPEEITGRESGVDSFFEELATLAASKDDRLKAALAKEEKKEENRLHFSAQASEFQRWSKETAERAGASHFGFDLPEVEAYKSTLDADDTQIGGAADEKQAAYKATMDTMNSLGVTDNMYTNTTLEDLARSRAELDAAVGARRAAYDAELARQRANDELCKKFAAVADPLAAWIVERKSNISHSQEELEAQLAAVTERLASVDSDGAALGEINALQKQIDEAGITNNRHTNNTAKDLAAQWEQWSVFLNRKKKMLEEEIEQKKLKGITAAEMEEIEQNFESFQKNGTLERRGLKGCMYSLGEELPSSKIAELMEEFGEGGSMSHDGFKALMIRMLGDSETVSEINNGFHLINRGDVATEGRMELVMDEKDVAYIKETAPKVEGGWDYTAWSADMFSR
eukprot:TRINITY_DN1056_c0_g1_i1.p1 TRINITY_DN1056_c0_g1~~TRINITY_DN1056_c0_g1_i1.p1  ORF type:complete len:1109 (-),score=578.87 TRINITY_DN1056_c0_g1_i1:133-3255(-)